MLRAVGALLLTAGATTAGFSSALRLRREAGTLRELEEALRLMEGEITATSASIPEICGKLGKLGGAGGRFFRTVAGELQNIGEASASELWARAAENFPDMPREVREMGLWIGRYDKETELEALESTRRRLRELTTAAEEKSAREFRARTAIGFASGAAAAILLL